MSIGSLGVIGSVTAGQLQQTRSADADKGAQDVRDHGNQADSAQKAEDAAGIGKTNEDEGADDRDADGRRLWERLQKDGDKPDSPSEETATPPLSMDPTGQAGANLDLTG
jgi:hypothetical protein